VGVKKTEDLITIETLCDGNVFAALVLPTALVLLTAAVQLTAVVLQSVSEWAQNWFKFHLRCHKSSFFSMKRQ
jgi:hypothetical protein